LYLYCEPRYFVVLCILYSDSCQVPLYLTLQLCLLVRMMSDYKVEMVNDGMSEFYVEFHGPRDSTLHLPPFSYLCPLEAT
jgi:hypothetical protein